MSHSGFRQFSVIVPETDTPTAGHIRRNAYNATAALTVRGGCRTAYEIFRQGAAVSPGGACLGWRTRAEGQRQRHGEAAYTCAGPFVFMTYREVLSRVDAVHNALSARGALAGNAGNAGLRLMGLYAKNCPEWVVCEQACFAGGAATVPLYDTLGPDTVRFVLAQTCCPVVVCGGPAQVRSVLAQAHALLHLKLLVVLHPDDDEDGGGGPGGGGLGGGGEDDGGGPGGGKDGGSGVQVVSLRELEREGMGAAGRARHTPPQAHDVATFCYTSGTTGDPKGALITHANLVASVANLEASDVANFEASDVHFSYLPLPHIFERVVQANVFAFGAAVGFGTGDPLNLVDDMVALQPTIFPSVPRVLNKMYDKITAGVAAAGGRKAALFAAGLKAKTRVMHETGKLTHWFWDRLLFDKIKAGLGLTRVRFVVTGSAPITAEVHTFFRLVLGVNVHEGYGQTEGCAAATMSSASDTRTAGHVGPPVPGVEMRLVDVPEMGYLHTDTWHGPPPHACATAKRNTGGGMPCLGRGEIVYRGPCVFKGYYKMPDKTEETFDDEGWLCSGDIGIWTLEGNLKIVDRKKNIFKLAQGEYVAAEKVENALLGSPLLAQAFVYGDSHQSYLVAVLCVDPDAAGARYGGAWEAMVKEPGSALHTDVAADIARLSAEKQLAGFEVVKGFLLESAPFSVENGLLTPTFKLKRHAVQAAYQQDIDALYAQGPNSGHVKAKSKL